LLLEVGSNFYILCQIVSCAQGFFFSRAARLPEAVDGDESKGGYSFAHGDNGKRAWFTDVQRNAHACGRDLLD
jgi:hypothetical protein